MFVHNLKKHKPGSGIKQGEVINKNFDEHN